MSDTYYSYFAKLSDTEELEITVDYTLGSSHSWWDGKPRPRGLKVRMTPVKRWSENGFSGKQTVLGDDRGRSFHVVDLKRKSAKQGQRLAAFVEENIEAIASYGVTQDWQGAASILFSYE